MKKRRILLTILLCGILILSGCRAAVVAPVATPTPEPTPSPEEIEINAFFDTYLKTDKRPIAIMVDNDDKNARPHAGLDEAYLIYELVVEGGATRFLAVFQGTETEKIGPVRSSRHYFLDYVMEQDAIYTHFGWSPRAIQDISSFGIDKINGVLGGVDESTFWREEKFKGDWHSAYTSIERIRSVADKKGYETKTDRKNGIGYADHYFNLSPDKVANTVSLPYSGFYKTGYVFNPETCLYEKTIDGAPHVMQSGEVLAVKNIIIQFISDYALGDGSDRRDMNTTGSGTGYYITNGAFEEITWSKSSRSGNTTYKKVDGTELLLNPGKTIVNIISPSKGAVIQ